MQITQKEWNRFFTVWKKESIRVQRLVKSTQLGKIGWKVIHQRKIKAYIQEWINYFRYLHNNPRASESSIRAATGIHWRGAIYMRYLGMVTEDKKVAPPAIRFYKNPTTRDAILQQQLEKWYYCVDDFFRVGDKTYKVFPFFVLLKILIEIGKRTQGNYRISIDEFRYFVLTTKRYSDYKISTDFILAYRNSSATIKPILNKIFASTSYDRVLFLLEVSHILTITKTSISIKKSYLKNALDKIKAYEKLDRSKSIPHYRKNKFRYFKMLYSDESLFEFCESESYIDDIVKDVIGVEKKKEISDKDETKIDKKLEKERERLTPGQLKERIKKILQRRSIVLPKSLKQKYKRQSRMTDREAVKIERTVGKLLANYYGCCQIIGCGHSFPKGKGGKKGSYCEAHHLQSLADDGKDIPENIAILCANHHRQFHYDDVKLINRTAKELTVELSEKQYKINIDYPI